MFNYKRLTFVFLLISVILTISDTGLERQARKSLLSLVNIVTEEGSQVTETAPSTFLDSLENVRIGGYNFFERQDDLLVLKLQRTNGAASVLWTITDYIVLLFRFLCSYVITFYPFMIFLLYMFFTSRFFRKNDYYGGYNY